MYGASDRGYADFRECNTAEIPRIPILGTSDIRMTLAIYTHATDEMQDAAIAALEGAFS
jgi:hypothetical protein